MEIFNDIIKLYNKQNLSLTKSSFGDFLRPEGMDIAYSITSKEVEYFSRYKDMIKNPKIFIIGNAFGLSTFCFKLIFGDCEIDVIDAEIEGNSNKEGSEITNRIVNDNNWDINLFIGFSPEDVSKAARFSKYDIVFIDGLHTNEQIIKDFEGISNFLNEKYICFFHDVGLCNMRDGFQKILDSHKDLYDSHVVELSNVLSDSGMGVISRGYEIYV